MHVSGFPLDLNWFLQFIATAFLIAVGLLHLLKSTASKYFVVDANFESSDPASLDGGRSDLKMPVLTAKGDPCVVCGNFAKKQCSGCKLVRYCSETCQSSHWRSGHKTKCKDFQLSGKVNSMQSATMQHASKGSPVALIPANGSNTTFKQSKKILFPYEDFVELFNWRRPGFPPCGLLNCGNSCFANVVLQCLAHTRPLVAYLLEEGHRRECRRNDWCFLCEFQTHIERATKSRNPFSPINILSRLPNIGGNLGYGEQEDAHEFMRFAIDTMQSVCLDEFGGEKALHPSSQETTLIQHIFGGHLQSQVICTKCKNISNQYENMMDLTVEIQGDAASLEECLDQFTVREKLHGDNMYKCDGCNDYVMAWKRLTIRRAPNILTIALKRFQSGRFGKLNKRVVFPETLDLRPYMSEAGDGNDIYKLYAVVVHLDMLNASFFGHYICYTQDFCGNWYRIDDCKVTSVELDEVLSQGAYMLLYSRVCAQSSCLVPIVPLRKEDEQIVAQEEEPSHKQPVQCLTTAESIHSIKVAASLSSDSSPRSRVSCCKEELSSISNSEYIKEDLDIVDCGSSSSVTERIEVYGGDSSAMEETSSVDYAHRLVGGVVSSSTEMCAPAPEVHFLSHESPTPGSCFEVESRAENGSSHKELVLMNSSTKSALPSENGISSNVVIADKMNCVGTKGKLEKAVSREGSVLSSDIEDTTGKLAGKNCSETKLKPLFPPGFLGKRPHKYVTEGGKAPLELGKLASACNLNIGSNGFAKPGFPHQNGGNKDHVGKPLPNCNNLHATSSSTSFNEQDGNFLNEGIVLGESLNLGNGNSSTPKLYDIYDERMNSNGKGYHPLAGNALTCDGEFHELSGSVPPGKIGSKSETHTDGDL